jgi:hypothetical protein
MLMKRTPSLLLPLAFIALLSGCSTSNSPSSTATTPPALTSNWEFNTLYPGPVPQNILYVGALSGQGTGITGVLRTNTCFSANQDIAFTGNEDTKGNLTLTSTNLPNNVVAITAAVTPANSAVASGLGTLTITGSAPCAPVTASIAGNGFAPLTGTFAGTLSSTSSATVTATASLTQSASANADGLFAESGTITITGTGCTNTFPFSNFFAGTPFTANATAASGPAATATLSIGVPSGTPGTVATSIAIVSTGCTVGSFAGSLTKQ